MANENVKTVIIPVETGRSRSAIGSPAGVERLFVEALPSVRSETFCAPTLKGSVTCSASKLSVLPPAPSSASLSLSTISERDSFLRALFCTNRLSLSLLFPEGSSCASKSSEEAPTDAVLRLLLEGGKCSDLRLALVR